MTFSPQSQLRRSSAPSAKRTRSMFAHRPFVVEMDKTEADESASRELTADTQPNIQARSIPWNSINFASMPLHDPAAAPQVQAKLTVGEPGDQYEQEADRTAAEVMRMPNSPVQREPLSDDKEAVQTKPIAISLVNGAAIQQKCSKCEQEEQVQRSGNGTAESGSDIESRLSSSKGGGSPLSNEVRSFMESRFGADFSQVRTHTGGAAVQMNQDLSAQAFTHGSDIYFGAGKSPANSDLTAHELTHVVQQTGSNQPIQRKMGDSHDLTSPRFAGDEVLEACFDGEQGKFLRRGAEGEAVIKVQQALVELGYALPKFGVDGSYEDETGAAVASFKQDNGITPSDPVVGPKTMTELNQRFPEHSIPPEIQPDQPPPIPPTTDNQPPNPQNLPPCLPGKILDDTTSASVRSLSSDTSSSEAANLPLPGVTCSLNQEKTLAKVIEPVIFEEPRKDAQACLIHLHGDEKEALATAKQLYKERCVNLVYIEHPGKRTISITNQNSKIICQADPNRIFDDDSIKKQCPSRAGQDALRKYREEELNPKIRQCRGMSLNQGEVEGTGVTGRLPVTAFHNNTQGNLNIESFLSPRGTDKAATETDKERTGQVENPGIRNPHIQEGQDVDNFMLVTTKEDFLKFRELERNVVLQKLNLPQESKDGSLSVALSSDRFINVEVQHGQLINDVRMGNEALDTLNVGKCS